MSTHAHLMIDPMADGTPVIPAAFEDHQITTVQSRASYRKDKGEVIAGDVEEVARLEHNAEAPEGPTTGKYEEWAYVSLVSVMILLRISTCTTTAIRVSDPMDIRRLSSRAFSIKRDVIRSLVDHVPMPKECAGSNSLAIDRYLPPSSLYKESVSP